MTRPNSIGIDFPEDEPIESTPAKTSLRIDMKKHGLSDRDTGPYVERPKDQTTWWEKASSSGLEPRRAAINRKYYEAAIESVREQFDEDEIEKLLLAANTIYARKAATLNRDDRNQKTFDAIYSLSMKTAVSEAASERLKLKIESFVVSQIAKETIGDV